MYNYEFNANDEKIVFEKNNGLIEIAGKMFTRNIVITNKNVLIFNDLSKNDPLTGRAVTPLNDYVLDLSISLDNIDYQIQDNNTILNYNNKEIVLYDILLNAIVK